MIKFVLLFLFAWSFSNILPAQVRPMVINSGGNSGSFSGGTLSWSVGEPVIGRISSPSVILSQGVLQSGPAINKSLAVTVFLEGLFNGSGMNKAMNGTVPQFPGDIADQVSLELHSSAHYSDIEYTVSRVNLDTSGHIQISIPTVFEGNYFVTVRHRNSIETTTALPVSFVGNSVSYDFDTPAKAYGANMKLLPGGSCMIYVGDVNQDGVIDFADMLQVDNAISSLDSGYLATDINGDGITDINDMNNLDSNASRMVGTSHP